MGGRSTALSTPPAGAGRTVHLLVPDFSAYSGGLGNNATGRIGTSQGVAIAANVVNGAPPATTAQNYRGRYCFGFSSAAGGAGTSWWLNLRLHPTRDQTPGLPLGLDGLLVQEIRAFLAFDRPAGDLGNSLDLGVGMSPGNNNQNMNNPAVGAVFRAGVQFGPGGPGKVRFRSRAAQTGVGPPPYAADFDSGNTAVAGFDERNWNCYAIRCVGGSAGGAGVCKALLNGVQFGASFDMSVAGAKFPNLNGGVAAVSGLFFGVTNNTDATFDKMYVSHFEVICAPDEASI